MARRRSRSMPPPPAKLSRRRFLSLVTAGALAPVAVARAASTTAAAKPAKAAPRRTATGTTPAHASLKEVASQEEYVARALRAIRDYPLPPGSEPGFVFAPIVSRRRGGRG